MRLRIVAALLVFAAPLAGQLPLAIKVGTGSPGYDFYGHGPYNRAVPRPDSLLGHPIGHRHTMYHQQQAVLDAMIAAAPDRVRTEVTGRTAEGKAMRVLIISSPANIARLDAIRADLDRLADPRATSASDAAAIAARIPAVAMLSHSIHGNEPAGFEAAMITAYTLLASDAPAVRTILDSTIVIINPTQNPDGHERFAGWNNSVAVGSDEPAAVEQTEPWAIQGRFNHYRFDMNRDVLAFSQAETRATAAAVLRWRPQLFIDLHSTTPQYFFPPAAQPVNSNIPAASIDWLERFGRGNASAFDGYGWQYYVRDVFDLYYPGYWDSWPSLVGATGMTFETDGGPELAIRKSDGSVTTFREGIAHHVVASFASLETLAAGRSRRLIDYHDFFASAMTEPSRRPFRRVVVSMGSDPARTHEVMALLAFQGIEVTRLTSPVTVAVARDYLGGKPARRTFGDGSYVIDLAQPHGRLATALLEPKATLDSAFARRQLERFERNRRRGENAPREGYEFYDVTAWALPLSHGLDAVWTDETTPVTGDRVLPDQPLGVMMPVLPAARSAYLIRPGTRNAQAMTLQLLREGFTLGVASAPLRADGMSYPAGTVVARTVRNPDSLAARVQALTTAHRTMAHAIQSAFPDSGQAGIGSEIVRPVRAPKVLVLAGDGVSQTSYGDVWWYLERELKQPFVPVEPRRLASMALDDYNVVILPEGGGYAGALGTAGLNRLRDWVRGGGALIALGSATGVLEHKELALRTPSELEEPKEKPALTAADTAVTSSEAAPFVSPSARGNNRPEFVPGAIARAALDLTHWLTWGYSRAQLAVPVPGEFLRPSKEGVNVAVFEGADAILAGFTWPGNTEKFLPGTAWATVDRAGRGTVVAFAESPLFRSFWRGPAMLFTNALLYGAGR
ncbi:MAG: M14 family zinc carboxypeptidase [Gemmatimonadales bacterium]|nr:M14 family zinc carboxypeptidase [Gemmatimonadales bacterium]MDZ4389361.1 M14 family zinc carboxypeptidase [Gemmatimonadales bacterium]